MKKGKVILNSFRFRNKKRCKMIHLFFKDRGGGGGKLEYDKDEILKFIEKFYSRLYRSNECNNELIDSYMSEVEIPCLNSHKSICMRRARYNERDY